MTVYDTFAEKNENSLSFFESRYVLEKKEYETKPFSERHSLETKHIIDCVKNNKLWHAFYSEDVGKLKQNKYQRLVFIDSNFNLIDFNIHKGNWVNVCKHFLHIYSNIFLSGIIVADTLFLVFIDQSLANRMKIPANIINDMIFCSSYLCNASTSIFGTYVSVDKKKKILYVVRGGSTNASK